MGYNPIEFETKCLFCGTVHDLHADTDGEDAPTPGDLSVCWSCGYVAAYGPDMQLTGLTAEQQDYIASSAQFKQLMKMMSIMKTESTKKRN